MKLILVTCDTFDMVKKTMDNYMDYYNDNRPQWDLAKLTTVEYIVLHLLNLSESQALLPLSSYYIEDRILLFSYMKKQKVIIVKILRYKLQTPSKDNKLLFIKENEYYVLNCLFSLYK